MACTPCVGKARLFGSFGDYFMPINWRRHTAIERQFLLGNPLGNFPTPRVTSPCLLKWRPYVAVRLGAVIFLLACPFHSFAQSSGLVAAYSFNEGSGTS